LSSLRKKDVQDHGCKQKRGQRGVPEIEGRSGESCREKPRKKRSRSEELYEAQKARGNGWEEFRLIGT